MSQREHTGDAYTTFRNESDLHRKLLQQEELILDVTEALSAVMERDGVTRTELARRLGKPKSYVTQLFGGRDMTLRTVADLATALGRRPGFVLFENELPLHRQGRLVELQEEANREVLSLLEALEKRLGFVPEEEP